MNITEITSPPKDAIMKSRKSKYQVLIDAAIINGTTTKIVPENPKKAKHIQMAIRRRLKITNQKASCGIGDDGAVYVFPVGLI